MKKLIARIKGFYTKFCTVWSETSKQIELTSELEVRIKDVNLIAESYEKKIDRLDRVYTPVVSYNSENGDKIFWPWVRSVLISPEYKYLIFTLRENTIREYTLTQDGPTIHEITGKLKMLQIFDSFLTTGLTQYDAECKSKI